MTQVNARILLWGIEGSGKTTTLETIHAKLRPELRGELHSHPTRLDPTQHYDTLAITLGEIGGVRTQIELVAVPGAPDQAMTRKQLLDQVDGIVLVLDASPERIESNQPAIDELRESLAAYGRRLDAFPIVLQYNKRDVADPFAIEALHRVIGLEKVAVFETIATTGHGILSTLTTISKHVVRARRNGGAQDGPLSPAPAGSAQAGPPSSVATGSAPPTPLEAVDDAETSHGILEAAILAEADDEAGGGDDFSVLDGTTQPDWEATRGSQPKPDSGLGADLRIVSVGQAALDAEGGVRLPLVLGDADGSTRTVVLSLRLDDLVSDGTD